MNRKERLDFMKSIGKGGFIVVGKYNQIRKCDDCGSTYFRNLKFVGDERRGEKVKAEYHCLWCGKLYEDNWFWRKFKLHVGKVVRNR